jgi:hypothetical protein
MGPAGATGAIGREGAGGVDTGAAAGPDAEPAVDAALTGCPQWRQKRASPGRSRPQLAQRALKGAPHWRQKRASAGFSCWQEVHRTRIAPGVGAIRPLKGGEPAPLRAAP